MLAQAIVGEVPPKNLLISPEVLARARRNAGQEQRGRVELAKLIFNPAKPAPGVVPKGAKLAMDSGQTLEVVGWASQLGYNSAFFEGTTFLGYAYLSELAQRAEYRVMTEVIASEMTREWIDLKATGEDSKEERIKDLADALKKLKVQQRFAKAAIHDGFFGRGHLYIDTGDTDDRDELRMPIGDGTSQLSKSKVNQNKPVLALRNVEPVWTYPTTYDSNDPLKPDWYKPTKWFVMGKEIHATRLLTFIGREVPDLLKPAYSFGGLSMSQMAKPYVDNWLKTRQSVTDIISAFSVMVLQTDLATSLQNGGDQLFARAELFNLLRNNKSLMMTDKNMEDFKNVSAPLGGLSELQAQTQEHMASVSRIPLVKLLGIQPAGLNASSEGEIRSFYDWIAAFQELLFRDNLQRVIHFVMLSLWGEIDEEITFEFKDLWQLDEVAKAALQKTKADTHMVYMEAGVVDSPTIRESLMGDPESPYAGLDLESLPEPDMNADGEFEIDPETGEEIPIPGEETPQKPSDPSDRLAQQVTNKAAEFGSPGSGGFTGDAAPFKEGDHPRDKDGRFQEIGNANIKWATSAKKNAESVADVLNKAGFKSMTVNPSGRLTDKRFAAIGGSNGILINPRSSFWKDPVKMAKQNHESGHLSTDNPMGVALHEISHVLYDPPKHWNAEQQKTVAGKVSKYAATNPAEFVSEVFAGKHTGKQYDEDVTRLFDLYTADHYKRSGGSHDCALDAN